MFTLLLSTFTFAQLTEDFESDITANGWTMYQTEDDDPGFVQTDTQANNGNSSYFHNDDNIEAESTSYMVSPAYSVQEGDALSVYVRQNYSTGIYYNYSGILISTSTGDPIATPEAFTEVFELGQGFSEDEWTQVTEDLSSYVGQTIYVAFKYVGDYQHEFYIDDFNIGESCNNPVAEFNLTEDCTNNQFSVNVNLTDLGSGSSVDIFDGTNTQNVTSTGTYSVGPFNSGESVTVTVSNADNNTCSISQTLSYVCPPQNDNCSTATPVSSFPYNLEADASGATQDAPTTCNNTALNDGVWFEIQAESAQYTINLTPVGWDAEIALFSGECGEQNCLENADSAYSGGTETLTFTGDPGTSYYLVIGHYNNTTDQPEGEYQLEILAEEIPCATPTELTIENITDLSADATWTEGTENSSYDLAWGETGFTPDTPNETGLTETSFSIINLTPSTSYDVYVRGNCNPGISDWVGPINFTTLDELDITPGTDCLHPIVVESLPYTTSDDTANYGNNYSAEDGSGSCNTSSIYLNGNDVVYAYTATEDGSIKITMTPGASWSGIFVYENCSDIAGNCIASIGNSSSEVREIEELDVTAGQTYFILISTYPSPNTTSYDLEITENTCSSGEYELVPEGDCDNNQFYVNVNVTDMGSLSSYTISDDQGSDSQTISEAGTLTFGPYASQTEVNFNFEANDSNCNDTAMSTFRCPSVGDNCENPIIVEGLPYTTSDDTANYFDDYSGIPGESCGSNFNYLNGDDVVYAYTPTEDTSVNISLTPGATYSGIFVYENCEDIGVNCVAGVANSTTEERLIEEFNVVGNQTYYIVISTWALPQSTSYDLSITENTCSSAEYEFVAVPNCDNNEFSVDVNVTSLGSSSSLSITDNLGAEPQTLTEVGTLTFGPYTNGTSIEFSFVPDDENCNDTATFSYSCPAMNNECTDAEDLTVGTTFDEYAVSGNNIGATDSNITPSPTCGGYQGGDVWYSVVAPASGHLIIETGEASEGVNFDTAVAVYSGNCDGDLVQIGCDDDGAATGNFSLLELSELTAGETLLVRVWRYSNLSQGSFKISAYDNLTCTPAQYTSDAMVDCDAATYTITYNFTDLGSSTMLTLTDDQGNEAQTLSEAGSITFGPYAEGTPVTISVETGDTNCDFSESFQGVCPASNDECDTAETITNVETGVTEPTQWTPGTVFGGTDSGIEAQSCDGYTGNPNDDVWYSFEAPVPDINITLDDTFDGVVELFEGTCNGLMSITCADTGVNPQIEATELTVGNTYFVRVYSYSATTPANTTFSLAIWSENSLGVNDFAELNSIKLYPNPTTDILNVAGGDIVDVKVYSMTGKAMELKISENVINTNKLSSGTYTIQLTDREGNVVKRKFIKK